MKKHYLIIKNEQPVTCCDDNNSKEKMTENPGSDLFELEENEQCPICSEEEQ